MTTATALQARYEHVMERVGEAARRSGRRPEEILVVAVTKYADLDNIRELVELGHRDFGESRVTQLVQRAAMVGEMLDRRRAMPGIGREDGTSLFSNDPTILGPEGLAEPPVTPVRWHMIGHLQRNKAKKCVESARIIHSVDSLRLVEEIQAIAYRQDRVVELLVQVNCTGEAQKAGCAVPAAMHLCEQIDSLVHLRVRGLMTMGPTSQDPDETRRTFERCREIFDEIHKLDYSEGRFNILSMGMSGDFETAIECGANMVRIGSGIFGSEPVDDDGDEG